MKKNTSILLTLILILLAASYYSYTSEGIVHSLMNNDLSSITSYINSLGILGPLALILIVILETVLAPIPPVIPYIAAGILFGPLLGGILVLVGNIIGAAIAFYIAKTFGEKYLSEKINRKQKQRFDKLAQKYGFLAIFLLRINPLTSSDIFSYLAGLSKMKPAKFLLATALGLAPSIFVQTYFGANIIETNPTLFTIFLIASLIYLTVFIYIIIRLITKNNKIKIT